MDKVAVANFIAETAFAYAYEIAGAVIGFSIILILIILFRDRILDLKGFHRVSNQKVSL